MNDDAGEQPRSLLARPLREREQPSQDQHPFQSSTLRNAGLRERSVMLAVIRDRIWVAKVGYSPALHQRIFQRGSDRPYDPNRLTITELPERPDMFAGTWRRVCNHAITQPCAVVVD